MDTSRIQSTVCTVCGTALRTTDRFCPSCGAPNPRYEEQVAGSQSPTGSWRQPVRSAQGQGYPDDPRTSPMPPQVSPPQRGNRATWMILGAIVLFFLVVCCCCALIIAISASQDSALQRELEGTARFMLAAA